MQLNYELVSPHKLSAEEKILLARSGKDFCFIRHNGVLKINKTLPKPKTLTRITFTMWQYDKLMDEPEALEIDALWKRVREIAGENAANQLYAAWREAFFERLEADNMKAAAEWLQDRCIPDELDAICDTTGTYNPGFIKALWSKTTSTDAIFLYGYQVGMEAARKAVLA